MASGVPIVRQIAWISIIPHLLVLALNISLFNLFGLNNDDSFIYGTLAYLVVSLVLRNFVANDQRKGMRLVKRRDFASAIPFFEKSAAFFTRHSWVDRYRYLTMLSSSRMSYREMGLCNIAFCYSQIGNAQQAKAYYEQTIKEFPNNGLALAGLKMIQTFTQATLVEGTD